MTQDFIQSQPVQWAMMLAPYVVILLAYLGYRRWRKHKNRTGQPDGR